MHQPKILCFSGSTRSGSVNQALAGAMAKQLSLMEADVTLLSLADYPLPLYNGDDEAESGVPDNAVRLAKILANQDGVFIVSPEYNASITPLMKNTLDWISRVPKDDRHPFATPVYALGAASPGGLGGMRGLAHIRQILVALGALVLPSQVSVGGASNAFDDKGDLSDARSAQFMMNCAQDLIQTAKRIKPYA